jgi:hypothetical protein
LCHPGKGEEIQWLEVIGGLSDQEQDFDIPSCQLGQELFSMMGSKAIHKESCFAMVVEISTTPINGR